MNNVTRFFGSAALVAGLTVGGSALTAGAAFANDDRDNSASFSERRDNERRHADDREKNRHAGHHHGWHNHEGNRKHVHNQNGWHKHDGSGWHRSDRDRCGEDNDSRNNVVIYILNF